MHEQWIIAMAVLLILIHPELTESSSNCYLDKGGQRQIISVDENATAIVSCPGLAEDDKRTTISLHKGDTKLHSTDMGNNTQQSLQKFQVFKENSSVSYKILRTEANDTGLYCCTNDTHIIQTILLIKDALLQPTESPLTCPTDLPLPLTIGCGVALVYNLFITVFSCYLACKLKNHEPPENPYMNTRPGGFRRH
ncbi:hypothetical protein ABG768_027765 [Culter alburnus]|uniref:Uncharacterized protein n=1 Tax=Culter alburnus TaxID=194366 RepID=A0AAW2A7B9_CULAL